MSRENHQKRARSDHIGKKRRDAERDVVVVIETNVDDITGEVLSRVIEKLLSEGAVDATATAYLGKRGRQGYAIRATCRPDVGEKIAHILMQESGSLGVKIAEYSRLIARRRVVRVPVAIGTFSGNVSLKIGQLDGKIFRIKPEFEEAKKISDSQKIPLRDVIEQINRLGREYLTKNPQLLDQGVA